MNQILMYWRSVARNAWVETMAAHNWKAAPLTRRVLAFAILCAALLASGGMKPLQDKLDAVLLAIAALLAVFVLEFLWRMFSIPARVAAEQTERIENLEARNSRTLITRDVIAKFEQEFRECVALQEQILQSGSALSVADFRKRADEWDKRVHALVKEYAPGEAFSYASIATLPHRRGISFLSISAQETRKRLIEFMAAKREKLRRLVMRLESRTI